jgi:hypothetical protein
MDGGGWRRERRRELVLRQVFSPLPQEPLIVPSSFRPALSSSAAHFLPSEDRQLNDILLIPREAVSCFFLVKQQFFPFSSEKEGNETVMKTDCPTS